MSDENQDAVIGGHTIHGTRIWCDRAPYDVTEHRDTVTRLVEHSLSEPSSPRVLGFTASKNLLPCVLVVGKISGWEPRIVR